MTQEETKKKHIPARSVDAELLISAGQKIPEGEVWTWDAMRALLGREARSGGPCYPALTTARNVLLRDHGIHFSAVAGEGLCRLTDAEKVATAPKVQAHVRRAVRKGARIVASADYEKLTPEDRSAHNTALSVYGLLNHITRPQRIKQLEENIRNTGIGSALAVGRTLEFFGNGGKASAD